MVSLSTSCRLILSSLIVAASACNTNSRRCKYYYYNNGRTVVCDGGDHESDYHEFDVDSSDDPGYSGSISGSGITIGSGMVSDGKIVGEGGIQIGSGMTNNGKIVAGAGITIGSRMTNNGKIVAGAGITIGSGMTNAGKIVAGAGITIGSRMTNNNGHIVAESGTTIGSNCRISGRNSQIYGLHVNRPRWTVTINDYVVSVDVEASRPVSMDVIGGRLVVRNLQYENEDEWGSRKISPATTTGNWEVRTDGITLTIKPPKASQSDQIKLTKKGPGEIEIQLSS